MEQGAHAGPEDTPTIWHGVVAGAIGATVVAAFFLGLDVVRAEAFRTPRLLADAVMGGGGILAFTLLHYAVFAVIGAGAVVLLRWAELPQNLLVGAVYGLFVCSILFYVSLLVTGPEVLPAEWWSRVLVGNLLAGLAMGAYLHWIGPRPGLTGILAEIRVHPTLREGFVAGAIGAVAVAAWFLVVDVVAREALFTPAALGSALFMGAGGPAEVQIAAGPVIGYTALHVAAFLLFGLVAAGLVAQAEKFPPLVWALVLLLVVFEVFFVGLVALLGVWILQEIAWWSVLAGNLLAAAGMGGYLWRAHPSLREDVRSGDVWATGH